MNSATLLERLAEAFESLSERQKVAAETLIRELLLDQTIVGPKVDPKVDPKVEVRPDTKEQREKILTTTGEKNEISENRTASIC